MSRERPFIYLDNNATTPVDPAVLETMMPYFHALPGNAASRSHQHGWIAEEAVDLSRSEIATSLNAEPKEIIFTSGATESCNLAIKGMMAAYRRKGKHLVTVQSEHRAVLDSCKGLQKLGAEITYVPIRDDGRIDPDEISKALRPDTVLVSLMWANNETGVLHPVHEIGEICARAGVLFFCDATQAVGKIPVDVKAAQVSALAFSGHKIYGPKGIGGLYISSRNPRVQLKAQIDGGGHERGFRAGTLNVPGIVGMGKAISIAHAQMEKESARIARLRDRLEEGLIAAVAEIGINGSLEHRLPNTTNIRFRYISSESLMLDFNREIGVSSSSACTSGSLDPSHVLLAMGMDNDDAHSALRFAVGRFNTEEEIDYVIKRVAKGVLSLRRSSPVWQMHDRGIL